MIIAFALLGLSLVSLFLSLYVRSVRFFVANASFIVLAVTAGVFTWSFSKGNVALGIVVGLGSAVLAWYGIRHLRFYAERELLGLPYNAVRVFEILFIASGPAFSGWFLSAGWAVQFKITEQQELLVIQTVSAIAAAALTYFAHNRDFQAWYDEQPRPARRLSHPSNFSLDPSEF